VVFVDLTPQLPSRRSNGVLGECRLGSSAPRAILFGGAVV
jgi:hypothetical protein